MRLEAGLANLAGGIARQPDGTISGPPGLEAPFGRLGGLGPPVAELAKVGVSGERLERILANLGVALAGRDRQAGLVRAVSTALANPEVVARARPGADEDARWLLDEALATAGPITVMASAYGCFAGYPDAEPPSWLLERGLLLPVTYSQLVAPREAALGLRGGLGSRHGRSCAAARPSTRSPTACTIGRRRHPAAVAAEGVCARPSDRGAPATGPGRHRGRPDLGRLARDLDSHRRGAALLTDLLVETGVLAVGGPFGQRSLGLRPEADAWFGIPLPPLD